MQLSELAVMETPTGVRTFACFNSQAVQNCRNYILTDLKVENTKFNLVVELVCERFLTANLNVAHVDV